MQQGLSELQIQATAIGKCNEEMQIIFVLAQRE